MTNQKELLEKLTKNLNIENLQEYFLSVLEIRGFSNQTLKDKVLLLTEEVGELAKAVRKNDVNMPVDIEKKDKGDSIESEIADAAILLISICNLLDINLFQCIIEKEKLNINRKWK